MKQLIIIGASGHGKVVVDIAKLNGYHKIAFLDDDEGVKMCMRYPVVGRLAEAECYSDADFFVSIGNACIREKIQNRLQKNGLQIISLIHPDAVIGNSVTIGTGTVIMAGVVVNPDTVIGDGCIINTGASIDHDNVIEDYVHVSVGSHLAGSVKIGKATWIGIGAVVSNNITICSNCMIGAGAVVVRNIMEVGTYIGVPVKKMEE